MLVPALFGNASLPASLPSTIRYEDALLVLKDNKFNAPFSSFFSTQHFKKQGKQNSSDTAIAPSTTLHEVV